MEKLTVIGANSSVSCSARMANDFAGVVRYFAYYFFYFYYFFNGLRPISKGTKHSLA